MPTLLPRRVPLLIEYRKANRIAHSLCYVLGQADGFILASATLDGTAPLGPVHIEEGSVLHVKALSEAAELWGVPGA